MQRSRPFAGLLLTVTVTALSVVSMPGSPAVAGVTLQRSGAVAPPRGDPGGASSTRARPSAAAPSDWTTFDHDSQRTGVDSSGNSFSPATPAWNSPALDGQLYGQPLEATGRVFAATENDTVYALAANSGRILWSRHLGTPLNPSTVPNLCGNIHPTVGITGTPVIDLSRSEIFAVATVATGDNAAHHLIGLDIYTGAVLSDQVIDPPGANPAFQLQRASLALTDGRVVVGFGGNSGDCGGPITAWWCPLPRTGRHRRPTRWPICRVTARVRCGWAGRLLRSTPRATYGWPPGTASSTVRPTPTTRATACSS